MTPGRKYISKAQQQVYEALDANPDLSLKDLETKTNRSHACVMKHRKAWRAEREGGTPNAAPKDDDKASKGAEGADPADFAGGSAGEGTSPPKGDTKKRRVIRAHHHIIEI